MQKNIQIDLCNGFAITFFSSISLLVALFLSIVFMSLPDEPPAVAAAAPLPLPLPLPAPAEGWCPFAAAGKVAILSPLSTSTVANFTSEAATSELFFFLPILTAYACSATTFHTKIFFTAAAASFVRVRPQTNKISLPHRNQLFIRFPSTHTELHCTGWLNTTIKHLRITSTGIQLIGRGGS